ncbi:MAG: nickel pincer cofactor biosynthesis protein LarC [Planctomycetota bacterium]
MRVAYFDCFSGVAGDMMVGALIDAGADFAALRDGLRGLRLAGCELRRESVRKQGLVATQFHVDAGEARPRVESKSASQQYFGITVPRPRDTGGAAPDPAAGPGVTPHRHYADIVRIIEHSSLDARVQERALAVFRRLGEVEAGRHGVALEEVHFHEVGAVDAIIDICGAALALELLQVDRIEASSINVGGGTVRCAHGRLPVPAPATAELLKGIPIYSRGEDGELTTPTGAALLSTWGTRFGGIPAMRIASVGYGAGQKNFEWPNVLRVTIGELAPSAEPSAATTAADAFYARCERDTIVVIETNIDDMNPEHYSHVSERLLAHGALDVALCPIWMKHGRPGVSVTILAPIADQAGRPPTRLVELIFREFTTLGLRFRTVERFKLARKWVEVELPYGKVRVKLGVLGDETVNIAPEHADCEQLARVSGQPLKEIYAAAVAASRVAAGRS